MNLPLYIAKRYLFSIKKSSIIGIISGISTLGIIIGTAAIVVTLAIYSGLNTLITSMITSFDADLKIELVEGKRFTPSAGMIDSITDIRGVDRADRVIEDQALIRANNNQMVVTIKGVDSSDYTKVAEQLYSGETYLSRYGMNHVIIGQGVSYMLRVDSNSPDQISIYAPKRGKKRTSFSSNFATALNREYAYCSGVFSIQQEIDMKYIIAPITMTEELFNMKDQITSIEITTSNIEERDEIQSEISKLIGDKFTVKNKEEQHASLYKLLKSERLIGFIVLLFILIISSFNTISSLTMLILDKQKDIEILNHLGATKQTIKRVFLIEGTLISTIGATSGLAIGLILCYLQQEFGLLKLAGDSYVTSQYPVEIIAQDIAVAYFTVLTIGYIATYISTRFIPISSSPTQSSNL